MYKLRKESRTLAGLYSIIATCEVNGVNPVAYLADVLRRAQTHPASRIDELLPRGCRRTRPESGMHTGAVHCSANA
jgi:IS66 C-terminal element